MSDTNTLAARRDARRRRILENSQSRLQQITGRVDGERTGTEVGPLGGLYGGGAAVDDDAGDSKLLRLLEKLGEAEEADEEALRRERRPPSLIRRVFATRVHMILLAAVVQWLLASDYGFVFGESVMLPLVVWEVTQLVLLRPGSLHDVAQVDVATALLVLCGISAQAAARVKLGVLRMLVVLQDSAVYFLSLLLYNTAVQWVA